MTNNNAPIGVMDSGVGGLSVVLALQKVLPQEDIVYYGDTANCPYGNKTKDELLSLSGNMLAFLQERGVKCVALACNTTSSLADLLRPRFTVPIITVAECAADAIVRSGLKSVGLIATRFTVASGIYENRIHAVDPTVQVESVGSAELARLVEHCAPEDPAVLAEIQSCMTELLQKAPLHDVILGCTHYPLVKAQFEACCPGVRFLDPAPHQALVVKEFLAEKGLLRPTRRAKLTVYTTGEPETFRRICTQNGLSDYYDTEYRKL